MVSTPAGNTISRRSDIVLMFIVYRIIAHVSKRERDTCALG